MLTCLCDCMWLLVRLCVVVCETTFTPFQSVYPADKQCKQADRFIRKESDGCRTAAVAKPTETVWTGWADCLSGQGIELYPKSCLLCPPYLCYLWLQHQRLRMHPRNVYVDLTATWEKNVLDIDTQTHAFTQVPMQSPLYAHSLNIIDFCGSYWCYRDSFD